MKRGVLVSLLVASAVTVSGAAYLNRSSSGEGPQFITAPVTRGAIVDTVEATGTLAALQTVQVGTQVSGTIKALHADFNSQVRKGQIIAELEPSLFQAQVAQAQATVTRLEADVTRAEVEVQDSEVKLRRARELWQQQLIARIDLEAAETNARQAQAALVGARAQVVQAKASLSQAQVNLANSIIRAPIDGVVISRAVDVGQTVAASMSAPTLFVIANDLSRMQVNAQIDESDIGRIKAGQAVTFKVDAYPGQVFRGTVSQVRLEPVTEQNVVSYTTIIDVRNPDMELKPGMTANVTVEVARADDVLLVPTSALRFRSSADATRVWVPSADGPKPVDVRAGLSNGATTALTDGALREGMSVITGLAQGNDAGSPSSSPLLPQRRGGARPGASTGGGRG
jgi:HlyD family secretion protein